MFSVMSQDQDGAGNLNYFWLTTRTGLSSMINIMVADELGPIC